LIASASNLIWRPLFLFFLNLSILATINEVASRSHS
jgi:hypothetical protein